MMNIEEVRKILADKAVGMIEEFSRKAVSQIYYLIDEKNEKFEGIGSGIFCEYKGEQYFITAQHCFDKVYALDKFWVFSESKKEIVSLANKGIFCEVYSGNEDTIDDDIRIFRVSSGIEYFHFNRIEELDYYLKNDNVYYGVAVGFPSNKNKENNVYRKKGKYLLSHGSIHELPENILRKLGVENIEHNVILDLGAETITENGTAGSFINPKGMSGGALFLVDFDDTHETKEPVLMGMLVENHKVLGKSRYYIAIHIKQIIRKIASFARKEKSKMPQIKIPAVYYRGGTSKGVFFKRSDLPEAAREAGSARDKILLRVLGSPDPYGKQIDGLGNASSSTSKAVILDKSERADHDVDYLFGQVSIDKPFVDWSGNCGNLTAAVGAFAIEQGLVDKGKIPSDGICTVKIWQKNIGKTIIAHVPMQNGAVLETGDFELDGVTFPAAEVQIEFLDPADGEGSMFPTGNLVDELDVPDIGRLKATLINAGIPTVFLNAADLGYTGKELQDDINNDAAALEKFEKIRAYGALKMGLINDVSEAAARAHTPKVAFVAPAADYTASSGKTVNAADIDLLVRALSMGKLHHAMMGTASVAIAAAAAVPGTLVNLAAGGGTRNEVRFGHPSGTLRVGASAECSDGIWAVKKAVMSRSARVIMEGRVRVPEDCF